MTMGVYLIKNTINGLIYIGKSKNCELRWKGKYNKHLTNAFKKYGLAAFTFEVIVKTDDLALMDQYEEDLIYLAQSTLPSIGYNMSTGGGNGRRGIKWPEAFKEHLRQLNLGKKMSKEAVSKSAAASRGRKHTPESIEKVRQAKLGKKLPPHTEETKHKMSEAKKGSNNPMWGREFSAEHRKKLSDHMKQKWAAKKQENNEVA